MGRLFFILLILGFFVFVFFKSDTLEVTYTTTRDEVNIEYVRAKYRLHWERFFDYLQDLPREFEGKAKSLLVK